MRRLKNTQNNTVKRQVKLPHTETGQSSKTFVEAVIQSGLKGVYASISAGMLGHLNQDSAIDIGQPVWGQEAEADRNGGDVMSSTTHPTNQSRHNPWPSLNLCV